MSDRRRPTDRRQGEPRGSRRAFDLDAHGHALMTRQEVLATFRIDGRTLDKWIELGVLKKYIYVGTVVRFRTSEVRTLERGERIA